MKKQSQFPEGWDEERVRDVLEYYENQTEDEALAEHEAALGRAEHTRMEVPVDLVPAVRQMIAEHEHKHRAR